MVSAIELARYMVAKKLADERGATYLIPGYLRGEMDDSQAVLGALADIAARYPPREGGMPVTEGAPKKLHNVREYAEGFEVEIAVAKENGRKIVRAYNQSGCDCVEIDAVDLLNSLREELADDAQLATTLPDAAEQEIARLRGLLIDPGDPPWEDARAILAADLRKHHYSDRAAVLVEGVPVMIPSYIALNLIGQASIAARRKVLEELREPSEAMVDAGVEASRTQSVSAIYRAMIGAAAKQEKAK